MQRNREYSAGGIGKGNGFLQSLVAVNRAGGGGWGLWNGVQRPTVSWTENMTGGARSSLFALYFFPDSKRHPSTVAITKEKHFQSLADRSRIRTRNPMYYNRASQST